MLKAAQLFGCCRRIVRSVFKILLNIYNRVFLRNYLTAKNRLFQKKLFHRCCKWSVKFCKSRSERWKHTSPIIVSRSVFHLQWIRKKIGKIGQKKFFAMTSLFQYLKHNLIITYLMTYLLTLLSIECFAGN